MTPSRAGGNPCTPDYIVGQDFNVDFTTDEFAGVIRWSVGPDCNPANAIAGGTEFTSPFAPTRGIRPLAPGELFYYGTVSDIHGAVTGTVPCQSLCIVDDKTDTIITITTSTPEIMSGDTPSVTVNVSGDNPTGGGVSGQWSPSNLRKNCADPIGSPATDFGITADITVDSYEAPIGGGAKVECGVWAFSFNYGGDACNKAKNSGCVDLVTVFCVTPATPSITTTTDPSDGYVGDTFFDTAELSGAYRPTGSITFTLYSTSKCGSPIYSEVITVSGNGSYETAIGWVATAPGTYYWRASYSGDSNNDAVSSACNEEPIVVHSKDVTITTTPSGSVAIGGGDVSDTATIISLNAHSLTGALTFNLVGPDNCDDLVATEDVPISGNGIYPNTPVAVLMPGTYHWTINYPGDANHAPYTTNCADETFTVTDTGTVYTPTIITTATPSTSEVGLGGHDIAKLSGGNFPTGILTFRLYGPADPTCSSPAVYTTTVAVDHDNGYYPCPPKPSFALVGDYYWTVAYGGDFQNNPILETGCGEAGEKVTVTTFVPKPMLSRFRSLDAGQMYAKPIQ